MPVDVGILKAKDGWTFRRIGQAPICIGQHAKPWNAMQGPNLTYKQNSTGGQKNPSALTPKQVHSFWEGLAWAEDGR